MRLQLPTDDVTAASDGADWPLRGCASDVTGSCGPRSGSGAEFKPHGRGRVNDDEGKLPYHVTAGGQGQRRGSGKGNDVSV